MAPPLFNEPFDAHRLLVNAIRAESGELRDLRMALDSGADVNRIPGADHDPPLKSSEQGASPLMLAVMLKRDLGWIDLLLNAGADVERTNAWGNSPLLIAIRQNQGEVVTRLLKAGADTSVEFGSGSSVRRVVHLAAREEQADQTLRALIAAGVPVNDPDLSGDTPLHLAAWDNRLVNVQTLLELGADPLLRNWKQQTALESIVPFDEHVAVRQVLEQAELRAAFPVATTGERKDRPRL